MRANPLIPAWSLPSPAPDAGNADDDVRKQKHFNYLEIYQDNGADAGKTYD
jgi:hypothetical protein